MSVSYLKKQKKLIVINLIIVLIAFCISLLSGRYSLSFQDILNIFAKKATATQAIVFFELRVPRTLLVTVSGIALALVGTTLQKLFRNPLASPDILGVTSGCSVGAAIGIVYMGGSVIAIQSMAFVMGILAMGLALLLASTMKTNQTVGLIIAGIITGAIATAFIMILKYLADPVKHLPTIDFWLMGGFHGADWEKVMIVAPIVLVGGLLLIMLGWQLQVLSLGREQALALGVRVKGLRAAILVITTFMISAVVSASGLISWIGLIAPHIVKMYCKEGFQYHLPLSALTGASLMLFADTVAKSLTTSEIPVSIVTTLIGAPILLYLAIKMAKERT